MTSGTEYVTREGITLGELWCPFCGCNVETYDAEDVEVFDGCVAGTLRWRCEKCGKESFLDFRAEYESVDLYADQGDGYALRREFSLPPKKAGGRQKTKSSGRRGSR